MLGQGTRWGREGRAGGAAEVAASDTHTHTQTQTHTTFKEARRRGSDAG